MENVNVGKFLGEHLISHINLKERDKDCILLVSLSLSLSFERCRLKLEQLPKGILPSQYNEPCGRNLHINDKRMTSVKYLQFVRDAVYAYAHALHNQWRMECDGEPGVCDKMRNADGSVLKYYLENANFAGNLTRQETCLQCVSQHLEYRSEQQAVQVLQRR